ncbi:MAG: DnaA N-terminal domain-containing protein [Chloroflexota bacterium]|nr:DnaA N-terminal domain-containing protein [Chloroflexota bacterium]
MSEENERTIVIRDRRKPNQYTTDNIIAREWLPILRIGDALYFYSVYLSMANKDTESSWGSLRTMAQYLQCSVDLVIRGNKLLEICELIFIDSGNERTSNEYYILDPPPLTSELKSRITARLDEIEAQDLGKNWKAWIKKVRKALSEHRTLPEIWQERRTRKGGRPPKVTRPTDDVNPDREPRPGLSENSGRESRAGYSWLTTRVFVSRERGARDSRTEQEQITTLTNIKDIIKMAESELVSDTLLAEMLTLGVAVPVAEILLEKYPPVEIARQIEWLPARRPLDPPAMLVSAIQGNWAIPEDFDPVAAQAIRESWVEEATAEASEAQEKQAGSAVPRLPVPGTNLDSETIWSQALHELRLQMTRATFDTCMQETYIVDVREGIITVAVRSEYARDWLESRLLSLVERTLAGLLGKPVSVQIVVSGKGFGSKGPDDSPG